MAWHVTECRRCGVVAFRGMRHKCQIIRSLDLARGRRCYGDLFLRRDLLEAVEAAGHLGGEEAKTAMVRAMLPPQGDWLPAGAKIIVGCRHPGETRCDAVGWEFPQREMCHCGDYMDTHDSPMNCGHSPVSMGPEPTDPDMVEGWCPVHGTWIFDEHGEPIWTPCSFDDLVAGKVNLRGNAQP